MAGPALVEQEGLDHERPEDAAGELGEDVDERVDRVDPPEHGRRQGHQRVEVPTADHAQGDDQPEEHERVDEPDDREVRAGLGARGGRDVEGHGRADREHQEHRADQLCYVSGESSILH